MKPAKIKNQAQKLQASGFTQATAPVAPTDIEKIANLINGFLNTNKFRGIMSIQNDEFNLLVDDMAAPWVLAFVNEIKGLEVAKLEKSVAVAQIGKSVAELEDVKSELYRFVLILKD